MLCVLNLFQCSGIHYSYLDYDENDGGCGPIYKVKKMEVRLGV
jgi:hypothetical protein